MSTSTRRNEDLATLIASVDPDELAVLIQSAILDHRLPKVERPEPKFRSEKAKAKGRESADAIWARHYAAAGVRRFKDLTPAQQKAAKAEVAAAWKAIPGTRKTKA